MEGCHRKAAAMDIILCIGNVYSYSQLITLLLTGLGLRPWYLADYSPLTELGSTTPAPAAAPSNSPFPDFTPAGAPPKTLITRIILTNPLFFSQPPGP
jgi:hypothetical protein